MKNTLRIFLLSFLSATYTFAQKVDLDKFYFDVSYQRLPQEAVEQSLRTYGVRASVNGGARLLIDNTTLYDRIKIDGWRKVEENPTVGIDVSLNDFSANGGGVKSETTENKDKDGKVTSRTTTYWYEALYNGRGAYKINGPIAAKKRTEAQEKEEAKKKEETKESNKFLKNAVLGQNDLNRDDLAADGSLSQTLTYTTPRRNTSSEAREEYLNNIDKIRMQKSDEFINMSINKVNDKANYLYGFSPVNTRDYLWILDSKSHPEYQTQQEAIQAVKTLFKEMKANTPIDVLSSNVQPLIEYFQSLKTKYTGNDKRDAKMRYSAYYNLAKIYYYLDKPKEALAEAEGLIKNAYDESDGENFKRMANELNIALQRAKVQTRHNVLE